MQNTCCTPPIDVRVKVTELMVEICSTSLVRTMGKVLLMKSS